MKKFIILCMVASTLLACKKDSFDDITYEVTLVNASSWHGAFVNEKAEVIGITDVPSGWRYSFKNKYQLAVVNITAYPDGVNNNADCYMKIYKNGSVIASGKSSVSPQVQFVFP